MIAIEQDCPFVQFIMLYVALTFASVDRKTEDVTILMKTIEHHCTVYNAARCSKSG